MFAFAGNPSLGGSPLTWNLFFARQPEPDLEFTEEELEQTTTVRSPSPKKPPKQSNDRPILWVLLLVLIGGGAYVAMEPEMVMEYIEPLLGESPEPRHLSCSGQCLKPVAPSSAYGSRPDSTTGCRTSRGTTSRNTSSCPDTTLYPFDAKHIGHGRNYSNPSSSIRYTRDQFTLRYSARGNE